MQKLLVKNIGILAGCHPAEHTLLKGAQLQALPTIENAWLAIEDGKFADFGSMEEWPGISDWRGLEVLDAEEGTVLPAWCDSHTHLVYAASREDEFADRIRGLSYQEIAEKGGGILNSARKMQQADEDVLFNAAMKRLEELILLGTGAIEIKSGYGLTPEAELKMLRVIQRIKKAAPIPVKSTYLGAHAIPAEFKQDPDAYVDQVIDLIPVIREEGLADYIDVFCEQGYFSVEQTQRIMEAGLQSGLRAKVHVNQFNSIGGVQACAAANALSVDHLEELTDADLETLMQHPEMISVGLPGCSLFLSIPYTPARRIIDAGLPLALASDLNPGSAPSGNMNLVMSLGCIKMNMLPEESINACTLNGAAAMELQESHGSITPGKNANFLMFEKVNSLAYLPYAFGSNLLRSVYINGKKFSGIV